MLHKIIDKSALLLVTLLIVLSAGCANHNNNIINSETQPKLVKSKPIDLVIINRKTDSVQEVFPSSDEVIIKPQSLWERMVGLYKIPEIFNKRIDHEYQWFLRHPDYLERVQKRAEPYLYNIIEQIETSGLPGELALLPIVESAFRPTALSHKKAAGLWQFIPSTGRYYGLKQNWWYDGRRDVYASTIAATQFLKKLADSFNGDWMLALASYNAGKGRIKRAIRRNHRLGRATDFWSLRLPKETMNYVPRLLALAKIFANAGRLNIPLRNIPNKPVFATVDVGSQLAITTAAKLADMPIDEFFKYNPCFNRWHTAPNGPHRLLIPIEKVALFKENLAQLDDNDRVNWVRHKIKNGENLSLIANKYGTSIKSIRQINRMTSNRIHAGKYILIPTTAVGYINHPYMKKISRLEKRKRTYTVKKGDTFWDISRKFSVTSKKLASWNNLTLASVLRPGQKLIVKKI